jgi:hypothetical protein
LTSLNKYMRWGKTGEVLFGENILPTQGGLIRVGDDILELSARDPRLVYGTQSSQSASVMIAPS